MKSSSAASAHCRSSKTMTTGSLLGEPLEEQPPRANRSSRSGPARSSRPSRCASRGSTHAPLLRRPARAPRRRRWSFARGRVRAPRPRRSGAHPHHLGERPVRDALAVGEAPAPVPEHELPRARRSTCRTPTTSRDLPIPAIPITDTRCALPLVGRRRGSRSFTIRSSRSRPTNGASRPCDLSAPPRRRSPAMRPPQRDRLGLALQLEASPASSYATAASVARRVASPTRTVPGSAARLDPATRC